MTKRIECYPSPEYPGCFFIEQWVVRYMFGDFIVWTVISTWSPHARRSRKQREYPQASEWLFTFVMATTALFLFIFSH